LLCDLAEPDGPHSREIFTVEAVTDDVRREQAAEHELLVGRGWGDVINGFQRDVDAC
jgi:hypothetical protein